ncbi:hypothetical protein CDAR_456861 [Caerostris darwini]|uniref:Uncharacterized protein n=1 Tax=Caerostris darwini TaxID=1538125 RepID=A0AAV4T6E8_9ARAC|nr:hypothetical protein CDAR_456861 [Caerostris darwini]
METIRVSFQSIPISDMDFRFVVIRIVNGSENLFSPLCYKVYFQPLNILLEKRIGIRGSSRKCRSSGVDIDLVCGNSSASWVHPKIILPPFQSE